MENDYDRLIFQTLRSINLDMGEIEENQAIIIQNQEEIISGDKIRIKQNDTIISGQVLIVMGICLIIVYNFVTRSLRC